jgi:ubiquinol-cytochrome c reductase iron-sulfur subunit
MRWLAGRLLAALAVWRGVRHRGEPLALEPGGDPGAPPAVDPRRRHVPADPRAETLVAALLLGCALAALAFVVLYVAYDDTQLLGLTGGLSLALLAGALIVAGLHVVPQVTDVTQRPDLEPRDEPEQVAQELRAGTEGVSRRRLLAAAGGAAGAAVAAAAIVPAASLGPRVGDRLGQSPWRRGTALVGEDDAPLLAQDVTLGGFMTAFPQGGDKRELGSPIVLVRLRPAELRLPPARARWAPLGIVAYSKICTHAGCAIALYRSPKDPQTSKGPGLVCPCHYSTFDPARAAKVVFGPAGRPLPQLPLAIDEAGALRAAGPLSGPVGPAWWGVRHA